MFSELNDTVVQILGFGITGLSFLLVFLAYMLLRKEQEKAEPRWPIIKTIWMFMGLCLIMTLSVGLFSFFSTRLTEKTKQLAIANQKVEVSGKADTLQTLINHISANPKTADSSSIAQLQENVESGIDQMVETIPPADAAKKQEIDAERVAIKKDFEYVKTNTIPPDSLKAAMTRIELRTSKIKEVLIKPISTNFIKLK